MPAKALSPKHKNSAPEPRSPSPHGLKRKPTDPNITNGDGEAFLHLSARYNFAECAPARGGIGLFKEPLGTTLVHIRAILGPHEGHLFVWV